MPIQPVHGRAPFVVEKGMSPRQRILAALRRREPDKIPSCSRFTPHMMRTFARRTGAEIPAELMTNDKLGSGFLHVVRPPYLTPDEYFGWELRHVAFKSPTEREDFSAYHPDAPPDMAISEWGVGYLPGEFHHYTRRLYPLTNVNSLAELKNYPFPRNIMDPENHSHLDQQTAQLHEDGLAAAGFLQQTLFELAWEMRGMDLLMMDFITNRPMAEHLLDVITEVRCAQAARYAQAGVDIIRLGDDLASQRNLLMSPIMCRELILSRLKRIIDAAREVSPEVIIFFHSDGAIGPLVGDLIDAGVDVLNPVQPECIDLAWLKREYGQHISFWGGIGIQTVMPFGSPIEVDRAVRETMDLLGDGGGFLVAPSHCLQPDVPWENVVAFFKAVWEHGWY